MIGQHASLLVEEEALHLPGNDCANDTVENESITADIPAWLQTKPGMGPADGGNRLDIISIVTAGRDHVPVAGLTLLGMRDMSVAGKEFCSVRMRLCLLVESVERRTNSVLDDRLDVREMATFRFSEPDEIQALGKCCLLVLASHCFPRLNLEPLRGFTWYRF
ncbi:hypothetical protein D3C71_1384450 [compost metagenome]